MEREEPMGYPLGYKEYQQLFRRQVMPGMMGFHADKRRPPVFANRMRVARQFEGLKLRGYAEQTEIGYEGLMRVFLAYTALERLADCLVGPKKPSAMG